MDTNKEFLGKLKLNQLNKNKLGKDSMKVLKGGRRCACYNACLADSGAFNDWLSADDRATLSGY